MKDVIKPLTKNILVPLGSTAAESAAGAGIRKQILRLEDGNIDNFISKIDDVIKLVKSIEESGLLVEVFRETTKNEEK